MISSTNPRYLGWALLMLPVSLLGTVLVPPTLVAAERHGSAHAPSISLTIANAESAAPPEVAKNATILAWPATMRDDFVVLRKGSNGWTCLPDRKQTVANDPMCMDDIWMEWMNAAMSHRPAKIERVGLAYMLQGGWAPDQRNPMQTQAGKDAYFVGPHIMVMLPDPRQLQGVSKDVHIGEPFLEALQFDHPVLIMPISRPGTTISVRPK